MDVVIGIFAAITRLNACFHVFVWARSVV
jgi:hypothetical protein